MKANEKTNVMRTLEQHKMAYTGHYYEADSTLTGVEIAEPHVTQGTQRSSNS